MTRRPGLSREFREAFGITPETIRAARGVSVPAAIKSPYEVFTTQYDRVEHVSHFVSADGTESSILVPAAEIVSHRENLDNIIEHQREPFLNLKTAVQDTLQFTGLSPAETSVTILVSCTGAMKIGSAASKLALITYSLGKTFDVLGVDTEILGYTTVYWSGHSDSVREWNQAGRPKTGRLNELRHIVFKESGASWDSEKDYVGLIAAQNNNRGLFKDSVDGEAVKWASERLLARGKFRNQMLFVVSREFPCEEATDKFNGDGYLTSHLRDVIKNINLEGKPTLTSIHCGTTENSPVLGKLYPRRIDLRSGRYFSDKEILDKLAAGLPAEIKRMTLSNG